MALNTVPIIPTDGTISGQDGAGSPVTITFAYEEGDFSVSGMQSNDKAYEIFRDRGSVFSVRETDEQPVSCSFSGIATEFSDGTEKCFMDFFLGLGAFSGQDSVLTDSDKYAVQVTFTADTSGAGSGGEAGQTIVLNAFIADDVSFSEGTPGKFSVSGVSVPYNGTAAVTIS